MNCKFVIVPLNECNKIGWENKDLASSAAALQNGTTNSRMVRRRRGNHRAIVARPRRITAAISKAANPQVDCVSIIRGGRLQVADKIP